MRVFVICPVRAASGEQKTKIQEYIVELERSGNEVYYPARDTNQNDKFGYLICAENRLGLRQSDEVHIFWDKTSQGSLFDLGMAFALEKKLKVINVDEIELTPEKSFTNMIAVWAENVGEQEA